MRQERKKGGRIAGSKNHFPGFKEFLKKQWEAYLLKRAKKKVRVEIAGDKYNIVLGDEFIEVAFATLIVLHHEIAVALTARDVWEQRENPLIEDQSAKIARKEAMSFALAFGITAAAKCFPQEEERKVAITAATLAFSEGWERAHDYYNLIEKARKPCTDDDPTL